MRSQAEWVLIWALAVAVAVAAAQQSTVEECKGTITALTGCLPYVTGKAAVPTPDCCKETNATVQHNRECLCKFIALVHQGSPQISSLGIQEAKLTALPSACSLKNVSANNCPKLGPVSAPTAGNLSTAAPTGSGRRLHGFVPVQGLVFVVAVGLLFPGFSN